MSDELREAADRLRRMRAESAAFDGGYHDTTEGRQQSLIDHVTLAEAWLAEHLADDDEAVTKEWLLSIGFVEVSLGLSLDTGYVPVLYQNNRNAKLWSIGHFACKLECYKTNGDVRRLLAALGIEVSK